eukprot:492602_1
MPTCDITILIHCSNQKHEHLCLVSLFIMGMVSLVGLSFVDLIFYPYIPLMYTIWAMYIPLFILFGFGLWSYLKKYAKGIFIFDIILIIAIIALIPYGIGMFMKPTVWPWGFVVFLFDYLFLWMLYGTWLSYKNIKNDMDSDVEFKTVDPKTITDV